MNNFLKLVSVENMKLWKRLSTKIMIIILVAIVVGLCGLLKAELSIVEKNMPQSHFIGDWKQELTTQDITLQQTVDTMVKSKNEFEKNSIDQTKMQIAENQYSIKYNINPNTSNKVGYWDIFGRMGLASIIALFAIIACTGLVAGEFSEGTMKGMISRPFKRWNILTAKFIAVFIYTIILTVISFPLVMVSAAAFFGTYGFSAMKFLWIGGRIMYVPAGVAALIQAGFDFLHVLVYLIIAFMLSSVFRSRALATGVSVFLTFMGSLAGLLGMYFSWGRLILFADTGFSSFITGGAPFYGITLGFALIISAIYCVVFLFAGYFTFAKRDIS